MWSLGLRLELLRWRLAGRIARLWWRDDDAAGATPALSRLLALSSGAGIPLTLAVIPAGEMSALAGALSAAPQVTVVQHGVEHLNRRSGPAAGEFPADWTRERLRSELSSGWDRIAGLPGALALFVPPWNDVHPDLEAVLCDLGYRGLSAHGALESQGLPRVDAHLDLMRWRGGARFRGRRRFARDLREALAHRRRSGRWEAPIGLLTHHLVHDEAAWAFLRRFLGWSQRQDRLEWADVHTLLGGYAPSRSRERRLAAARVQG